MANLSVILFESIAPPQLGSPLYVFPMNSAEAKGCGYYGNSNGLHTVEYSTSNGFNGKIKMQATLATKPTEADWFDVVGTTLGDGINPVNPPIVSYNFTGNFVWVRAVIVGWGNRPPNPTPLLLGSINRVLFTHN